MRLDRPVAVTQEYRMHKLVMLEVVKLELSRILVLMLELDLENEMQIKERKKTVKEIEVLVLNCLLVSGRIPMR